MITVQIQSERGESVAGPLFWEEPPLPSEDDPRFPCLRFVDLYGDTVFNQLQIPQVLQELRLLRTAHLSNKQASQIGAIEMMIEQHARSPHLYLKFIGD